MAIWQAINTITPANAALTPLWLAANERSQRLRWLCTLWLSSISIFPLQHSFTGRKPLQHWQFLDWSSKKHFNAFLKFTWSHFMVWLKCFRLRGWWIKWSDCYVGSHNAAHCDVGPTPSYTQRPVRVSSQTHQTCCVSFETKTQNKPHLLSYLLNYEQVQTGTEQLSHIQDVAGLLLNIVDISKKLWQRGAMWRSI